MANHCESAGWASSLPIMHAPVFLYLSSASSMQGGLCSLLGWEEKANPRLQTNSSDRVFWLSQLASPQPCLTNEKESETKIRRGKGASDHREPAGTLWPWSFVKLVRQKQLEGESSELSASPTTRHHSKILRAHWAESRETPGSKVNRGKQKIRTERILIQQ